MAVQKYGYSLMKFEDPMERGKLFSSEVVSGVVISAAVSDRSVGSATLENKDTPEKSGNGNLECSAERISMTDQGEKSGCQATRQDSDGGAEAPAPKFSSSAITTTSSSDVDLRVAPTAGGGVGEAEGTAEKVAAPVTRVILSDMYRQKLETLEKLVHAAAFYAVVPYFLGAHEAAEKDDKKQKKEAAAVLLDVQEEDEEDEQDEGEEVDVEQGVASRNHGNATKQDAERKDEQDQPEGDDVEVIEEDEEVEGIAGEEGAADAHQLELEQRMEVLAARVPAAARGVDGNGNRQHAGQQDHQRREAVEH